MASDNDPNPKVPQGLGSPGLNPLFVGVLAGVVLGVIAGLKVDPQTPKAALQSELVFRIEVGLIVAVVAYWAASALWLAWHRTLFRRLPGNAGPETPDQQEAVEQRDERLSDFIPTARETMQNHTERLEHIEDKLGIRP